MADVTFDLEGTALPVSYQMPLNFSFRKRNRFVTVFIQQQKSTFLIMLGEFQCFQMEETIKQNAVWKNSWC